MKFHGFTNDKGFRTMLQSTCLSSLRKHPKPPIAIQFITIRNALRHPEIRPQRFGWLITTGQDRKTSCRNIIILRKNLLREDKGFIINLLLNRTFAVHRSRLLPPGQQRAPDPGFWAATSGRWGGELGGMSGKPSSKLPLRQPGDSLVKDEVSLSSWEILKIEAF